MKDIISVCIPVNNEQATIENTIHSIELQELPPTRSLEVLVCANGCGDRTEEIVRELAKEYKNIQLYSEQKPSKPLAWNLLMEKSLGDQVIFTDGDVLFDRNALVSLTDRLEKTGKALIAGKGVPYLTDESFFQRKFVSMMTSSNEAGRGFITGQLYGISKPKVKQALSNVSLEKMPEDLIAEDFWLGCLVGEDNWEMFPEAKFHYRHSSWQEFHKINSRFLRARRQLGEETSLVETISLKNPVKYYLDKLLFNSSVKDKAKMISRFFIRRGYSLASQSYSASIKSKDNTFWERAESTKRPIPLELIYHNNI